MSCNTLELKHSNTPEIDMSKATINNLKAIQARIELDTDCPASDNETQVNKELLKAIVKFLA